MQSAYQYNKSSLIVLSPSPLLKIVIKEKNLDASRPDLLSIPVSGGGMSKRLGGIIGCKYKTSYFMAFKRAPRW